MAVYTLLGKKKMNKRRGFSMLLFPLPLARNKENENIESRILIDCAPRTMILVYTLPAALKGKDCCRRGRILCPRYELP